MLARARFSLSPGDIVAGIPVMAYVWLGLTWRYLTDVPRLVVFGAVFLALCAVPYGALLVALDDLVSWRRSPELGRWLARVGAQVLGCLLFVGDAAGLWRWICD